MENGDNLLRVSRRNWEERKKKLGFDKNKEQTKETIEADLRILCLDIFTMQALLESFDDIEDEARVLERWRNGLFKDTHGILKKIKLKKEASGLEKEKSRVIHVVIDIFSEWIEKLKNLLNILEKLDPAEKNKHSTLKEFALMSENFISALKQATPETTPNIIREFKKKLIK